MQVFFACFAKSIIISSATCVPYLYLQAGLEEKFITLEKITRFTNKYYKYDVDFDFFVGLLSRREFNFSETRTG